MNSKIPVITAHRGLAQVGYDLICQFGRMDETLGDPQIRRTERARLLYKAALNDGDPTVRYWFRRDGENRTLRCHLQTRPSKGTRRHAWVQEDGASGCDCPDHVRSGFICKHIRAVAGIAARHART
jgi:hypothetical protein